MCSDILVCGGGDKTVRRRQIYDKYRNRAITFLLDAPAERLFCEMRMAAQQFLAETGAVGMQVYLRCGYRLMPEHHLYGTQVSAPFEQMCGEGVPERMGRYFLGYSRCLGELAHNVENHHAGEPPAAPVEKEIMEMRGVDLQVSALLEPSLDCTD